MSMDEDYRPCQNCGTLTDSGVCSQECVQSLESELVERAARHHECYHCAKPLCHHCQYCHTCDDAVPGCTAS